MTPDCGDRLRGFRVQPCGQVCRVCPRFGKIPPPVWQTEKRTRTSWKPIQDFRILGDQIDGRSFHQRSAGPPHSHAAPPDPGHKGGFQSVAARGATLIFWFAMVEI
jgi:hypothetical protein